MDWVASAFFLKSALAIVASAASGMSCGIDMLQIKN